MELVLDKITDLHLYLVQTFCTKTTFKFYGMPFTVIACSILTLIFLKDWKYHMFLSVVMLQFSTALLEISAYFMKVVYTRLMLLESQYTPLDL